MTNLAIATRVILANSWGALKRHHLKTSIYLTFIIALTVLGCGQVNDNMEDLATRNELLLKSINADYERFENTPIYRRTKLWYPKRLQPLFRFLTDDSKLKDKSLQQQRLDSLQRLTNQILNHHKIIKEPTISLCKDQLRTIQNKLNSFPASNKEVEAFRNEVLQLEKILLYSDLQKQHHMSFSLIDTLGIKVIPESKVVKLGEPFKAKVYFASYIF